MVVATLVAAGVGGTNLHGRSPAVPAGAIAIEDGMPVVAPQSAISSSWFCPGPLPLGSTGDRSSVALANEGPDPVTGQVVLVSSAGKTSTTPVTVPADSKLYVPFPTTGPTSWGSATVDLSGGGVAAEQVVFTATGSTSTPCSPSASARWYFPMGTTAGTADLRLGLYNPGATPAIADLSFDTGQPLIEVSAGSSSTGSPSAGPSGSGASGTGGTSMPAPATPLAPSALQGLAVAPGQLVVVDIAQQVQLRDLLATSVAVSGGLVVAGEWQSMSGFVLPPTAKGSGSKGSSTTSTTTTLQAGKSTSTTSGTASTTTTTSTTSTTTRSTTSTAPPPSPPTGAGSTNAISKAVANGVLIEGAGRTFEQWWLPDALSPNGAAQGLWLDNPSSVSARVRITVSGAAGVAVTEVELPGGGVTTVVPQLPASPPSTGHSGGSSSKPAGAPPAADSLQVASAAGVGIVVGRGSASTVSVTTKNGSKTTVKVQTVVSPQGSLGLATASRSCMFPATGWISGEGEVVVVYDVGPRPAEVTIGALPGASTPVFTLTLQPGSSQAVEMSSVTTRALGVVQGTTLTIISSQPVVAEQDFTRGSAGELMLAIPVA